MNLYLTNRDKKLLEVVFNKIRDKQEQVKLLKFKTDDANRRRELDSKDAGLSIATSIISNMIWHENKDYFKGEIKYE